MKKKSSKKKTGVHPLKPAVPPRILELEDTGEPSAYELALQIKEAKKYPHDKEKQDYARRAREQFQGAFDEISKTIKDSFKSIKFPLKDISNNIFGDSIIPPDKINRILKQIDLVEKPDRREPTQLDTMIRLLTELRDLQKEYNHNELVTLSQAAAIIQKSKRTLENYLRDEKLPPPDVVGGDGKSNYWYWGNIRPELEKLSSKLLPERFPTSRFMH